MALLPAVNMLIGTEVNSSRFHSQHFKLVVNCKMKRGSLCLKGSHSLTQKRKIFTLLKVNINIGFLNGKSMMMPVK